jgi:hypothetical protein
MSRFEEYRCPCGSGTGTMTPVGHYGAALHDAHTAEFNDWERPVLKRYDLRRTHAIAALAKELSAPLGGYWRAVQLASQSATDSDANIIAINDGNDCLYRLEEIVTKWVNR